MSERITIGSRVGRVLSSTAIAFIVVGIGASVIEGGIALLNIPPLALIGTVAWALYWMPSVSVSEDDVTFRNVLRTVRIPWGAIESVETRRGLTIVADGSTHRAWAAPAPGLLSTLGSSGADLLALPGSARMREPLQPTSRARSERNASSLVLERWEEFQKEQRLEYRAHAEAGQPDTRPATASAAVRWHLVTITAVLVLAVATVLVTTLN